MIFYDSPNTVYGVRIFGLPKLRIAVATSQTPRTLYEMREPVFRENKEEEMNEKKYLVYLDILGFERLAEKIEEERGIESREVREKFINVLNERINTIERGGRITGKKYGESDDWLLLTDSLENVFESIFKILDNHTPYKGYEKIPLEIAIGTGEYDKWARFEGEKLIIKKAPFGCKSIVSYG